MNLVHLDIDAPGLRWRGDIPSLLIVQGRNESGKTTLLTAIQVAAMGTSADGADRFLDGPTTIDVRFNPSPRIVRTFKGRKQDVRLDGKVVGTKAADALIGRDLGDASTFSVGAFLALNKREQLSLVSGWSIDPVGWDIGRVDEEVTRATSGATSLSVSLADDLHKRLGCVLALADTARAYVEQAITMLREVDLAANSEALRLGKIVEQDRREASPDGPPLPSGTTASWRDRVAAIDAQGADLRQQLGAAEQANAEVTRAAERVATRAARLEQIEKDLVALRSQQASAATNENAAKAKHATAVARLASARSDLATKQATYAEVEKLEREQQDAIRRKASLAEHVPTLRPLVEALGAPVGFGPADAPQRDALLDLRTLFDLAEAVAPEGSPMRLELAATSTNAQGLHASCQALARIVTREVDAERTARSAAETEAARVGGTATRLADAETTQRVLLAETDEAQVEQLAAGTADTSALQEILAALRVERGEAQRNADRLSDHDGKRAARDQRALDLSKAVERRTLARAMVAAFVAVQAQLVEQTIHPMLRTASEILHAVYGYDLELDLVDDSRSLAFEVRRPGGPAIPIEHTSKSVKATIGIGLRVAFLRQISGWRALIVDDLEHVDLGKRELLIRAVLDAGVCDNVLFAAVSDGWVVPGEWPVVNLSPGEAPRG